MGSKVTELHEHRYFDSDPTIRRHARELYEETRALPIISPHGHVDPAILANNDAFPDPSSLIITPDHYILRMLYSRGIPLEALGVAPIDGNPPNAEQDPRQIWQTFADHWQLFRATPTRAWLEYELHEVFGVGVALNAESAMRVYDMVAEQLQSPEFRPRALTNPHRNSDIMTNQVGIDMNSDSENDELLQYNPNRLLDTLIENEAA